MLTGWQWKQPGSYAAPDLYQIDDIVLLMGFWWDLLLCVGVQERKGIQGLHDSLFSSSTGELRALDLSPSFSDTLWAACMVNSRCFSDNAGRELLSLMVPLADMANHSNEPNAAYRLHPSTQTFAVTSTKVGVWFAMVSGWVGMTQGGAGLLWHACVRLGTRWLRLLVCCEVAVL